MTDDPNSSDAPASARPRKRPTVIEGEAKDVSPAQEKPNAQVAEKAEPRTQEPKPEPAPPRSSQQPEKTSSGSLPQIAGAGLLLAVAVAGGWYANSYFAAPAITPAVAPSADAKAIAALKEEIARLTARLEKQETPRPTGDIANERTSKLEVSLSDLRAELAEWRRTLDSKLQTLPAGEIDAVQKRLSGIEQKITALNEKPKDETPRPTEIVALGALRDAVASGAPFVRELELVRSLLKERASPLAGLEKHAAQGLPTVAALTKQFESLASQLAQPPQPEGGVVQRLWNNAGRLIEVRPVGEPKGNQPGAIVARMETKLARGNLAGALEESKALTAASREIAKDWFALAERRRDADATVKGLLDTALAAVAAERNK